MTDYYLVDISLRKAGKDKENYKNLFDELKNLSNLIIAGATPKSMITICTAADKSNIDNMKENLDINIKNYPLELSLSHETVLDNKEKNQAFYFVKLKPPRPSFINDMTEDETEVMQQHFEYLEELFSKQKVVIAGNCLSEAGYEIIILQASTMKEVRELLEDEPAVKTGIMTSKAYEFDVLT